MEASPDWIRNCRRGNSSLVPILGIELAVRKDGWRRRFVVPPDTPHEPPHYFFMNDFLLYWSRAKRTIARHVNQQIQNLVISQNHMKKDAENNDVDFEPEEELGDLGAAQAKLKKLKEELAKAKQERQEYLDGWQRCKADSVNARKEALQSAERQGARAKEGLIEDIIPALDGFDLAMGTPAWESVDAGWRSGIEQIRNQFLDVLAQQGVERFGKVGDTFDHALHEAVEERDDLAGESGTVQRILRYGYRMNGRVLRPAQVIVKR